MNTPLTFARSFGLLTGVSLLAISAVAQQKPAAGPSKKQSEVASKAKFAEIDRKSAMAAKPIDAHKLDDAKKLKGKAGAFTGTVTKVFEANGNSVVILNFDKDFQAAVTAVLFPKSYAAFPDMSQLKGRELLVTGKWELYKDRPEIVLTSKDQIKIIKAK